MPDPNAYKPRYGRPKEARFWAFEDPAQRWVARFVIVLVVMALSPSLAVVHWHAVEGGLLILYPIVVVVVAIVALVQTFDRPD